MKTGHHSNEDGGVSALEGEELARHQEFVVNGVRAHLGEGEGMDRFLAGSKAYGRGFSSADEFISLLVELFGRDRGLVLVPTLAKLIRNDGRRKLLVDTAANWPPPPIPAKVQTIFDDDGDEPAPAATTDESAPAATTDEPAPAVISDEPAPAATSDEPAPAATTDDPPLVEPAAEEMPAQEEEVKSSFSVAEDPSAREDATRVDTVLIAEPENSASVDEAGEEPAQVVVSPPLESAAESSQVDLSADKEEPPPPATENEEEGDKDPPLTASPLAIDPGSEEVLDVVENTEREMVSVADFLGSETWQLAVCEGDRLRITKEHEDGWTDVVSVEGGRGAVPTTFLEATPETVERDGQILQTTTAIRALVEGIPASYKKVANLTRAYAAGRLESTKFRNDLVDLVGELEAVEIGKILAPLVTENESVKRFLENDLNEDEDWIERLRISRQDDNQAKKGETTRKEESRNPFAATAYDEPPSRTPSNPFEERQPRAENGSPFEPNVSPRPSNTPMRHHASTTVQESPTHYDEREILLSRSHGVGAYNPETMERLQRLREDEELAQKLQREEELAAARPHIQQHQQYLRPRPEQRQDSNDDFWGSLFGTEQSTGQSSRRNDEQQQSSSSAAVSGADVWTSIFGANTPGHDRARQELDDERFARQLQAEEARAAGRQVRQNSTRQPPPTSAPPFPAPPLPSPQTSSRPDSPPSDQPEVGLFRCGACSETMHVRNAVPGAQFSCPICGRVNTI